MIITIELMFINIGIFSDWYYFSTRKNISYKYTWLGHSELSLIISATSTYNFMNYILRSYTYALYSLAAAN